MAVDVTIHVVPFALNNATGNQTITDPDGPGTSPKFAIFVVGGATGLDTPVNTARASVGITDGTNHRVTGMMAEHGALTALADTGRRVDPDTVINMCLTSNQGLDYEAAFVSFGTDAVTISNSAARTYRGFVILGYGADLEAAVTDALGSASIGGTASISGLAFAPDTGFFFSAFSSFTADTGLNNLLESFGFAGRLPSTTQACFGAAALDLEASATSTGQIVRDDAIIVRITNAMALAGWLELTAWNSDGITVTTRDTAVAIRFAALLLRVGGRRCWAGAPRLDTNATGSHSFTGVGMRGKACVFVGAASELANDFDDTLDAAFSLGGADGSAVATVGFYDGDAETTSDSHSIFSAQYFADVLIGSSTHVWIGEFVGITDTGFDYSIEDASASDLATPTWVICADDVTLSPGGIASTSAFGTPAIVRGAVTLSPSGIASGSAFGTPTVTQSGGAVTLSPGGIASTSAFGTPSLQATITLSPGGIASGSAFGTPSIVRGAVTLSPGGIASGSAFGTPSIVRGAVTLSPGGIASGSAFGTPSVFQGFTLLPDGIASGSAFGTPALVAGAVTLSPGGIASASAFGAPALVATITLSPSGIASTSAFGTPALVAGAVTLSPGGIASGSAFGTPTIVQVVGGVTLSPSGIASTSAFGLPFVRGGFIPTTMKKRIHDALCERAHLGTFVAATYPVSDEGCVLEQGLQVQPRSVEVNELKGSFTTDNRFGAHIALDRSRWLWLMILRFDQEVVAELFERALEDDPVVVCRDKADPAARQARLLRVDCDYVHPPRGNPSNGTELRYRFEAVLSPK